MPLDTFICGQCEENFNDIQLFIIHKKECIPITTSAAPMVDETPSTPSLATEETAVQIPDALEYTAAHHCGRPWKGKKKIAQRDAVPEEFDKLPILGKARHCGRPSKKKKKNIQKYTVRKKLPIPDKVDESEDEPEVAAAAEEEEYETIERNKNHSQDIFVFSPGEKVAFKKILNIDLSVVDHMFRVHVIEQDLNENAPYAPRAGTFGLSLYSCNTCDKVFKTLSHIRLHCLIHTNLKPFKCSKCSYASNSKGNLYSHMHKHAGHFYVCSKCPFKTVNRTHLLDHEATHNNVRQWCKLCKKDYNTIKSLITHVRKYHSSSKKGKEYLAKFLQGRQDCGPTVIHQCHVCNRKFKKKFDCDRHLLSHDIKDIPHVQHSESCDYSASRRIYLEKHFLKHRVIYCCCLCQDKFLSTVRLLEHINTTHVDDIAERTNDSIFEQSIASSLYLPEPDDTLPDQDKEFDNLPPELSAVAMNNTKDDGVTEPMETSLTTSSTTMMSSNVISNRVNISGDPIKVEICDQTYNIAKYADAMVEKLQETNKKGVSDLDTFENGDLGNVTVKVEAKEGSDYSLNIAEGNELKTASEIDTAAGNVMINQENPNFKSEKDSSTSVSNTVNVGEERLKFQNNDSETGEIENGEDVPSEDEDAGKSSNASDIITRLGYRSLSLEIFQKMRQTFGTEECEFCGRLFYNRADYEPHVRTHTVDESEDEPEVAAAAEEEEYETIERNKNHSQDIFVFSPGEKVAFKKILNIDLSVVDHMFRVHVIEQDLNENAPSAPRAGTFGLSLYSCNTCDKVFKTLSHIRLHCLIHTNLKPFKCSKCSYASNSKGNLYSHMHKHAGHFYVCSKCPFKTVNRTHLLDHEATHNNVRQWCKLCKKDYNTIKSLITHVRKYHSSSKKGKEYLAKFLQGRQDRCTAVIHQCHVCNRKFKKKFDCDRHLFVHDIKDIPRVQHCELCNYSASRRIYLEKHFLKHRVIYCCCLCQDKFLSTVRLLEHINTTHVDDIAERTNDSIFEQSIASSLYLPEPDDTLPDQDKEFDNLPPELSAVAMNNTKDDGVTEPMETSLTTSSTTMMSSNVISNRVNISGDPIKVEICDQTYNIAKYADAMVEKLQETNKKGVSDLDTFENGDLGNVTVKVEAKEGSDYSLNIAEGNELKTASEIDTAAGNVMINQENPNFKSEKDSSTSVSNTVNVGEERLKFQNNDSETGEIENGEDVPSEDEDAGKSSKASDIITRLGYRPLSLEIFQKMRQTFGTEECEFCGRLFYNRADYEPHVRTHTARHCGRPSKEKKKNIQKYTVRKKLPIPDKGFDHQERTVQSDSSQIVTVNLETIIVQEETQGTCKQPVCDGTRWGINCIWEDAVRSTQSRHPEHCNYRISSGNCPMC